MHVRPAWLEIDLTAIADNIERVLSVLGNQRKLIAVVKDDAYGHGATIIGQIAEQCGAHMMAVSLIEEAIELQPVCPQTDILILGLVPLDAVPAAIEHGFHMPLDSADRAQAISQAASEQGVAAKVHIKIDSGMHRIGVPSDEVGQLCRAVKDLPNLDIRGIFTHFASAPDDPLFTTQQFERFQQACREAESVLDGRVLLKHCANSAAAVRYPEMWLDAVRPGALLYGIPRNRGGQYLPTMDQALSVKAMIAAIRTLAEGEKLGYGRTWQAQRDSRIAQVPLGYGDGYDRHLSNKGELLLRGRRVPVVGTVCMDSIFIDVTDMPDAKVGEEVVLVGSQGGESVTIAEIAERCGTVVQEVPVRMNVRLPRVYTCQPGDERVAHLADRYRSATSNVSA